MKKIKTIKQPHLATLLGGLSLFFWSTGLCHYSVLDNIPQFEILSIILSISFFVTVVRLVVFKRWHLLNQPILIWCIGFMGVFGNDLLFVSAIKHAPVYQIGFINYLWPLLILLFIGVLPKEKFSLQYLVAGILGFYGVYLVLCSEQNAVGFQICYWQGYLLAFSGAVLWAVYSLFNRYHKNTVPEMVGCYCGLGAVISLSCHLRYEQYIQPEFHQWGSLCFLGLACTCLGYYFWDHATKFGNIKLLGVISQGKPIVAFSLLIVFTDTHLSVPIVKAIALIIIASLIASNTNFTHKLFFRRKSANLDKT